MALIRQFQRKELARNSLHEEIDASYAVFERDGKVLVQIDSYGRKNREIPGKLSQTIQLDEQGAAQLVRILKTAFGFN